MQKKYFFFIIILLLFAPAVHAQWISAADSSVYYNTNNIGIGINSPAYKLDVDGDINFNVGGILRVKSREVFKADSTTASIFAGGGGTRNVSGKANMGIGYNSLFFNRTGKFNTATGFKALYKNNGGSINTATGYKSLVSNTNGHHNTAAANLSMFNNTSGSYNAAFGKSALYHNTTGNNNTANGNYSLYGSINGVENTSSGVYASATNTGGSYNAVLGGSADMTSGSWSNTVAIGGNTKIDASNKVMIGNTSVTSIGGEVNWTSYSDERVKKSVKAKVPGLSFINALRPVTYHYSVAKKEQLLGIHSTDGAGKYDVERITFTGLIAQEVDEAAKKMDYDFSGIDKTGNIWGLRYTDFIASLIKSVQEISAVNDLKKKRIAELSKQLEEIKSLLLPLQQQVQN